MAKRTGRPIKQACHERLECLPPFESILFCSSCRRCFSYRLSPLLSFHQWALRLLSRTVERIGRLDIRVKWKWERGPERALSNLMRFSLISVLLNLLLHTQIHTSPFLHFFCPSSPLLSLSLPSLSLSHSFSFSFSTNRPPGSSLTLLFFLFFHFSTVFFFIPVSHNLRHGTLSA